MSMEYREYPVRPPLDAAVECVWFLRGGSGRRTEHSPEHGAASVERVLPDGCMELIVHFGDPFVSVSETGRRTQQASSVLAGMLTRPLVLEPPARVETMGVRFRPGGAYPFVAVPLAVLTDHTVALDDLWGAFARRLVEQLGAARSDDARLDIITRELSSRLVQAEPDRLVGFVVGNLTQSAGRARVASVARRVGVTPRHLQRRFADRVGVSPKVLARILRFQNTLRHRTASTPVEWARVAVDCGYADQSHLIREYAAFAGETPASLLAAEGELSSYFTAPHRLAALLGARR
jgi:AraC-like DNA-binding protein